MKSQPHIAVVGAGAFGGWTAVHLLERGAHVTLLDAWGPGNSRASSGGETRIMRGTYGPDQPYTELAARALALWPKYERRWKRQFLHRTGVLWMVSSRDDSFERGALALLRGAGIKFQELSTPEMRSAGRRLTSRLSAGESSNPSADTSMPAPVARRWWMRSSPGRRVPAGSQCRRWIGERTSAQLKTLRRLAPQGRSLRFRLWPVDGQAVS